MPTNNFLIYRSSAGSGKTFTLTKEYLKMALTRPNYFKHILAVTFTNKATQEMKDRILGYLQELAAGSKGLIYDSLIEETGWGGGTLKKKAQENLSAILHEYSHFSVSTIDSFFQKVIRAFAKEMGLQSSFTIELDVQKALDYAIDELMLDISEDKGLAAWLIEFSESRMDQGKSWDIRKEINKLGYQLFSEEFKKHEKQLLVFAKDRNKLKEYFDEVAAVKNNFVNHLSAIGANALTVLEENGLSIDDFSYKKSGMVGYFLKLNEKTSFEPGSRARASLETYEWCNAKHEQKELIYQLVENSLHPLMESAITYYDQHVKSYATAENILKYFYTFGIMADLMDKLDQYRKEESVMLITDVNGFLKDVIGGNDAPFIYEKVGSFYRHFMIDEFQDTSAFQWDNFLPLIQNGLAEGRPNLVVGDVKQSIYRWRGGDWQLLLEGITQDVGKHYTEEVDLTDNWRSKKEIINFNNAIFTLAPVILSDKYSLSLDFDVNAEFIRKAYNQAVQNIPKATSEEPTEGYVKVDFLENDKESEIDWKDTTVERTITTIEQAQDRGVALRDIAVLVRRNSEGKKIADALLEKQAGSSGQKYRYDVISPDSLFIGGSRAVRILISCLTYLNNKDNMLALAQLVYDYLRLQSKTKTDDLFEKDILILAEKVLPVEVTDLENGLIRLPVFDLCEKLITLFDLGTSTGDISYIQGFQEAVLDFTRDGNDDATSFLVWWENYGSKRSVQSPETLDAIKIMTIHKSKGLQFDTVIMPFTNWAFDHSSTIDQVMWLSPEGDPFNKLPLLPVKYGNSLINTEFVQDFARERLRAYLDNLNLMYVAFTRAKKELHIYAPAPKQSENGLWSFATVADLLYHSINPVFGNKKEGGQKPTILLEEYWNDEEQSFSYGRLNRSDKESDKSEEVMVGLKKYQSTDWNDRLYIRRNAQGNLHSDGSGLEYGQVMHEILSRIEYVDDLEEVLDQATYEGWMPGAEMKKISKHLKKVLAVPEVASWFDRKWTVRTEVTVLQKNGEIKRLDRVMEDNGSLVIIDYKTGLPGPKDIKQVKNYVDIVSKMQYKEIKAYLFYLGSCQTLQVQ